MTDSAKSTQPENLAACTTNYPRGSPSRWAEWLWLCRGANRHAASYRDGIYIRNWYGVREAFKPFRNVGVGGSTGA